MIKFFGDSIHDKLFPNEIKRFTEEEKLMIDKFIIAILKLDNHSDLQESFSKSYNDRVDRITEVLVKKFIFKKVIFNLTFSKYFSNDVKDEGHTFPYELMYDGYNDADFIREQDRLLKDFAEEGSITGIIVKGYFNSYESFNFILKSRYGHDNTYGKNGVDSFGIRTRYEGDKLTKECKHKIGDYHFNIIWDAIQKLYTKK